MRHSEEAFLSKNNNKKADNKEAYFNPIFSHIYVERSVREHPRTRAILAKFPAAEVIEIGHYKDIFCRGRQSGAYQRRSRKLILAEKKGTLLYAGAPVCQSFGNRHFYYTSCVMNCVFDCEYCYLQGMYPSANLVIFVNLEDFFAETERMLGSHPLYLCVSYDTDLLAAEAIAGYAREWSAFAGRHPDLKLELRTKCANQAYFKEAQTIPGVIYAFTLSPQALINAYEHHTAPLGERLACAAKLLDRGACVRLCFDPMLFVPDWKRHYGALLEQAFLAVDFTKLVDVSVGTFRISQAYLKNMRKQRPASPLVWFPYQSENGCCHYPDALLEEMEQFLVGRLEKKIAKERIFRWKR